MIESITIAGLASYQGPPQTMDGLSRFNYIFGPNGSGKTTISRVIAAEDNYPECNVGWKANRALQTLVYNRDFVDRNFVQSAELKGVFTLGEEQIEILEQIAETQSKLEQLDSRREGLVETLSGPDGVGGKRGELRSIEDVLKEKCWAQKRRHDDAFAPAFAGVRNSGENFKVKVLEERVREAPKPPPLEDLLAKARTVFGASPVPEPLIPHADGSDLLAYEDDPVLQRRVVGKDDAGIAELIEQLGNSDWVRHGRGFVEASDGACPFCQQELPESFLEELDSYYDETYRSAVDHITGIKTGYAVGADKLLNELETLAASDSRFLDQDSLAGLRERLSPLVELNKSRLAAKEEAPSEAVSLEPLAGLLGQIEQLVNAANTSVQAHNRAVSNLDTERTALANDIWQHIVQIELADALNAYDERRTDIEKAVTALETQIQEVDVERTACVEALHRLERSTTSIEPTVRGINALLQSVGFSGFSVQQAGERNSYKLVRPNGKDAKETLSEGEQSFVTFLYFYHLIRGSVSESGISTDRVVVFDDPVSSLDSDVLFVVSSLIKGLFEDVREGRGPVKQVFVLTHNVYFHREVTFNPRRRDTAMREETFWIVRKVDSSSTLVQHGSNPVRTSYELLWDEIRSPVHSSVTIQNTLRRILENYFTILGSVDLQEVVNQFEGRDRAICRSLLSWVNAGSHYAFDDLYVSATEGIDNYLRVFRQIFEKSNQEGHYRMMMGDAYEEVAEPN